MSAHTPGPWCQDDGYVLMEDQAANLIADIGTDREWVAIGIHDDEGFSEVVALSHPINASLISAAPEMFAVLLSLAESVEVTGVEQIKATRPLLYEIYLKAKAAIAKAEGSK